MAPPAQSPAFSAAAAGSRRATVSPGPSATAAAATAAAAAMTAKTTVDQELSAPRPFSAEDDDSLSVGQHMFAGGVAGMFEHMVMYPVDSLKTRMQSYGHASSPSSGIIQATRTVVAAEGPLALWRGIGAVAISAGPAHALYFATYEAARNTLAPSHATDGQHHPIASAFAGVSATFAADGLMCPMDVVKQRLQLAPAGTYSSVLNCITRVHAEHGVPAFFAGFRATILMNVPFTAVYFSGYESAKKIIVDWRGIDERQFTPSSHCAAGALAGGLAAAASTPLDVARTRLQTQGEVGARRYRGLKHALESIKFEEGWRGLFRGVRPRVVFHMPAAAVCWTTYEFCKHLMAVDPSHRTD
jgi:solute carrier family 25 (mitochondrial iron transporter), member 28/37